LNALREKGYGCEIICPLSSKFFKFVGYAFVDDTDVIQSALTDTPCQAKVKLQEAIDLWEFSLKATCGALVPEKTVWWLVSFVWDGCTWQYASIQDSPGELQVNDISNCRKLIKRLEANEAYETVRVFLAPDGNSNAQFEKMKKAVISWTDGLQTGKISRDEVWLALQSTILRTLYYPLPTLCLTKAQCEAIMSPLLQYCLPALGICRNFPHLLVFAPYEFMGLNIWHLHTLQELMRLKDIVFNIFNSTLTGLLYASSLELLLLELGCNTEFQWSPTLIDHLSTAALVKETWKFLHSHRIILRHDIKLSRQRIGDQFIMETILALNPPLEEVVACNHCRMYLRAIFLSDIVTGDGISISDGSWNGDPYIPPYKLQSWPHSGKPPRKLWDIWRKWIRIAFLGRGRRLKVPLGAWFNMDNMWPWYVSSDGGLFQCDSGNWFSYEPVIRRNRLPTFEGNRRACRPYGSLRQATVIFKGDRIVCTGSDSILAPDTQLSSTFLEVLRADKDIAWCLYDLHIQDKEGLISAIKEGTAMAISDGSYKDTLGTASWTIGDPDSVSYISGKSVCLSKGNLGNCGLGEEK